MHKFHKNKEYFSNVNLTANKVREEINNGLMLLNKIDKPMVTFFGAHKMAENNKYYKHAEQLAYKLGKKGYAIITGGGPGAMKAANCGATKAKAPSLGLRAELLEGEKITDPIFTHKMDFHFLFIRRFIMSIKSEALIFYPGGYGTLNEIFEYAVLMQTGIVDAVPIICVNKKYWQGLFDWLKNNPLKKDFLINDIKDFKLLYFVEDFDDIIKLIK